MKKKLIRKISLITVLSLSMLVAGCGKGKEGSTSKENMDDLKNYVYKSADFPLEINDANGEYLNDIDFEDGRILATIFKYEEVAPQARGALIAPNPSATEEAATEETATEESTVEESEEVATEEAAVEDATTDGAPVPEDYMAPDTSVIYRQYDLDGKVVSEFSQKLAQNSGIQYGVLGKNGTVYSCLAEYGTKEMPDGSMMDANYLKAYSEKGEELWSLELGTDMAEGEYYFVNGLMLTNQGKLAVLSPKGIEFINEDGSYDKCVTTGEKEAYQFLPIQNGNMLISAYGDQHGMEYFEVDLAAGKMNPTAIEFPFNINMYNTIGGSTTDLILTDVNGIFTYNLGDKELTKIMDFVASDIMNLSASDIIILPDGRIFSTYYDNETMQLNGMLFTKVAPEDVKDKKNLLLAGTYVGFDVRTDVIKFNKANDEYRIMIKDYSSYNTEDDYSAGMKRLNTDIASGMIPDILIADGQLPIDSYINKGLLADLYTFMDEDSEIKREDYLENVFEAYSKDGKLYQLMPSFYVSTVVGKKSDVGNTAGWTFDDLNALLAKKDPETAVFAELTAPAAINYSMMFGGSNYIDWSTGECHFTDVDFINVLEFAKQFPMEIDYEALQNDETYWEKYETMYRDGRTLLMPVSMSNFRDFNINEKGMFGEDIIPIGFPNEAKESGVISGNIGFAISAKSEAGDVAWQFLRHYLSDEYQEKIEYAWPVKKSVINKMAEKAQKRPVMEHEDGSTEEYDDLYYINGQEIVIPPMTKEETDELINYISSITKTYTYNMDVMLILEEECAPFFEGKKSAKEVAEIIQSRVQIYVNENR